MRYLMLVCQDAEDSVTPPGEADRDGAPDVSQWWQAANDAGNYVMGDRLRPAAEAMTVRVRSGELLVTQGPFTEASEVVAGFDVLECDSMQQAVQIASGHPMAHAGVIELRAMWPFDGE
ncbi:MAG: YciI family protein [Pedococcus sp.]